MKKLIACLFVLSTLVGCGSNDSNTVKDNQTQSDNKNKVNELIFGSAYGMCQGETCIETFRLTKNALFEDKADDYKHEKFDFHQLDNASFEKAKGLLSKIPDALWNTKVGRVGCPDCADGGGIYIQYSKNGEKKSWFIDNNLSQVPTELHAFIKEVKATINKINNIPENTSGLPT